MTCFCGESFIAEGEILQSTNLVPILKSTTVFQHSIMQWKPTFKMNQTLQLLQTHPRYSTKHKTWNIHCHLKLCKSYKASLRSLSTHGNPGKTYGGLQASKCHCDRNGRSHQKDTNRSLPEQTTRDVQHTACSFHSRPFLSVVPEDHSSTSQACSDQ